MAQPHILARIGEIQERRDNEIDKASRAADLSAELWGGYSREQATSDIRAFKTAAWMAIAGWMEGQATPEDVAEIVDCDEGTATLAAAIAEVIQQMEERRHLPEDIEAVSLRYNRMIQTLGGEPVLQLP